MGVVLGWVTGIFREGTGGGTETFVFAAGAFLVVVLTFVWLIVTDSVDETS